MRSCLDIMKSQMHAKMKTQRSGKENMSDHIRFIHMSDFSGTHDVSLSFEFYAYSYISKCNESRFVKFEMWNWTTHVHFVQSATWFCEKNHYIFILHLHLRYSNFSRSLIFGCFFWSKRERKKTTAENKIDAMYACNILRSQTLHPYLEIFMWKHT